MSLDPLAWLDDAACRGKPTDWWFPPEPEPNTTPRLDPRALAICAACPVTTQCGQYAISTRATGVWAGRYLARTAFRTRQARTYGVFGCGTPAGYQRHLRAGTTPCGECRHAHARRISRRRVSRRDSA